MNEDPIYIKLDSTASTNSYLSEIAGNCSHGTVVVTGEQTAGRGQRGNTWEAEPGKNLTFSILLRPEAITPYRQFAVSEIVSVAIVNILQLYISDYDVAIKWPNDIYVHDSKICGILIENSLMGANIDHSIAGIGINVNQRAFHSNAPNPVSLFNIIGNETKLDEILDEVCREILALMNQCNNDTILDNLHQRYCSMLWRGNGLFPYRDNLTGQRIMASIASVDKNGMLTLKLGDGSLRTYAFKEITALLH